MSAPECILFAGQADQRPGMGAELWRLPAARQALERLTPHLGDDLEELTTRAPAHVLARTRNTQRAMHAQHLGYLFALRAREPELELDGAIGHSVGVVAALVAAGALEPEDSARFIAARGEAFALACAAGEPHGLAAVTLEEPEDEADLTETLAAEPALELALHNAPGRCVIGGPRAALDAFAARAQREEWPLRVQVLEVEGAFHTAAFAGCRERLAPVVAALEVRAPRCPVFMGTSGQAERDPARIRELLLAQPARLERHLDAVRAAHAAGCRRFVEPATHPGPSRWLGWQLGAGRLPADVRLRTLDALALRA
ncbi:MAG: ACP S-malonyltransferase [Planctomycetota bacterium]